jgi:hypothetical protein
MASDRIDRRGREDWIYADEIQFAPSSWGRPLRSSDARQIAANFDADALGYLAIWYRPNLDVDRGRYVVIDGQHRLQAVRLAFQDDRQRIPCLLYEGLTNETAAELSLMLQSRRNLHALDRYRAALACHDRREVDISKLLHFLDLDLVYTTRSDDRGRLSAVAALCLVWDRTGVSGLERVLTICSNAWDRTSAGFSAQILKLVMTLIAAHNGEIDDAKLTATLAAQSPAQWLAKNSVKPRPLASIAQDVIIEYNKRARGPARLTELTPSQYLSAAKRPPSKTVRGKITAERTTSVNASSTRPRRARKG